MRVEDVRSKQEKEDEAQGEHESVVKAQGKTEKGEWKGREEQV